MSISKECLVEFLTMSLQLEGFDGAVRGHRILVVGKEHDVLVRVSVLEGEALYKGRTILVLQEPARTQACPLVWFKRRWDVVFRVKDPFEAQMLATYVANAPKPVRIVWVCLEGVGEIPRSLWSRWQSSDVTLIGMGAGSMMSVEWEVMYFAADVGETAIEKYLTMRGTGCRSLLTGLQGHLGDLRDSGAALVWTNVDQGDSKGALYWYDPSEGSANLTKLTKKDVAGMLEEIGRFVDSV